MRRPSPKKLHSGELATPYLITLDPSIAITIVRDMGLANSSRPAFSLDAAQLGVLLDGLDELNKSAYAEYRRAPQSSLTPAALNRLINNLDSFRKRLDLFDAPSPNNPLPGLFQATTLHMQMSSDSETDRSTPFTPFGDILGRLDEAVVELRGVMIYLKKMRTNFRELSHTERWDFFFNAPTRLQAQVNQAIYPYICKTNGIGPDTYVARHLDRIYERTFGEPISYSRIKADFANSPENTHSPTDTNSPTDSALKTRSRQFHDGMALRFACSTIRWLKLYKFMSPDLISDPDAPFPWDAEAKQISPWETVKNRIATIWENDKARADRNELYS